MPFSRHWIRHIEAMCRIKNELCRKGKGLDGCYDCDNLHKKYDFQKIQEILGYDLDEGLKLLEEKDRN